MTHTYLASSLLEQRSAFRGLLQELNLQILREEVDHASGTFALLSGLVQAKMSLPVVMVPENQSAQKGTGSLPARE
jgi:phosphoribosylcarboxyaminoimidazole (NCAIR) mutase